LFDVHAAVTLRQQDELDRDTRLAWLIADLVLVTWVKGRPPDLRTLLTHGRQAKPQSIAEQRAQLQILAGRLGRPLQQKGRRRMTRDTRKALR
jgi:hypothetical protein